MPPEELATCLTGGVTAAELPGEMGTLVRRAMRPNDFVLAPLPNHLFTRDTSAWVYGGVSLNPMCSPARQKETLNIETVYRHHPRFRDADFEIWFGGADHDWGDATLEGGDIIRSATACWSSGRESARTRRPQHPRAEPLRRRRRPARDRGADAARARAMHLDTVSHSATATSSRSTSPSSRRSCRFCTARTAREACTPSYRSARSSKRCRTLGSRLLSWHGRHDRNGNDVVALAPGVIVACERTGPPTSSSSGPGSRCPTIQGNERRQRPRRRPCDDVPDLPRRVRGERPWHDHRIEHLGGDMAATAPEAAVNDEQWFALDSDAVAAQARRRPARGAHGRRGRAAARAVRPEQVRRRPRPSRAGARSSASTATRCRSSCSSPASGASGRCTSSAPASSCSSSRCSTPSSASTRRGRRPRRSRRCRR